MDGLYLKMQAEYDKSMRARERVARVRNEIEKSDANSFPRSVRSLEKDWARSTDKVVSWIDVGGDLRYRVLKDPDLGFLGDEQGRIIVFN